MITTYGYNSSPLGGGNSGGWGMGNSLMMMGGIANGIGSIMAGNAQASQYYSSAQFALEEGKEALAKGKWQQRQILRQGHDLMAEQKERYGESSVTLEGTPMDILEETQRNIMQDALMVGRETAISQRKAYLENKAYRKAASSAKRSGILGAFSSLAQTAGTIALLA